MVKKSFHIFLSAILLLSHIYLTIGTHFCGGEVVETIITVGASDLGCKMGSTQDCLNMPSESTYQHESLLNEPPCCQNEYQTLNVTSEYVNDATQATVSYNYAIALLHSTFSIELQPQITFRFSPKYIAPPFEKDVQTLFQTFLC
jgi:hypothetical protein